jgi:hypothetical protein
VAAALAAFAALIIAWSCAAKNGVGLRMRDSWWTISGVTFLTYACQPGSAIILARYSERCFRSS